MLCRPLPELGYRNELLWKISMGIRKLLYCIVFYFISIARFAHVLLFLFTLHLCTQIYISVSEYQNYNDPVPLYMIYMHLFCNYEHSRCMCKNRGTQKSVFIEFKWNQNTYLKTELTQYYSDMKHSIPFVAILRHLFFISSVYQTKTCNLQQPLKQQSRNCFLWHERKIFPI